MKYKKCTTFKLVKITVGLNLGVLMRKYIFGFVLIILMSCDNNKNFNKIINPIKIIDIVPKHTHKLENKLLNPRQIANINDEFLIILEDRDKNMFNVFDLSNLKHLYKWGRKGRGPNEFSFISFNTFEVDKSTVILYEPTLANLKYYNVNNKGINLKDEKSISVNYQNYLFNGLTKINDTLFIAFNESGFEADKEFMVISPKHRKPLFYFSKYPETEIEEFEKYQNYSKILTTNQSGTKIASFYRTQNSFKIYNSSGVLLWNIKINDPKIISNKNIIYRVVAEATEKFIYTLSINKTEKELEGMNPIELRPIIEIWDWKGNQIGRYRLGEAVHNFTISEKHKKIYAYSVFNPDVIYEFSMPIN